MSKSTFAKPAMIGPLKQLGGRTVYYDGAYAPFDENSPCRVMLELFERQRSAEPRLTIGAFVFRQSLIRRRP